MRFTFCFAFSLSGRCRFVGRLSLRRRFPSSALGAVEFVLQSLVQAKGLLPAVEFMARELRLLLIRAKIQLDLNVGHEFSLRRAPF
jgi:hypothetical protein